MQPLERRGKQAIVVMGETQNSSTKTVPIVIREEVS